MSVIRVSHDKSNPYVMLNKRALESKMSWQAKGLWAYLISRPDNWNISVVHLVKEFGKDKKRGSGKDAVTEIINELIEHGYVVREQSREKGIFQKVNYIIYEFPVELKKCLPQRDKPLPAEPLPANPPLISNEVVINKENKQPAPMAVVVSLDKLKISDDLKKKISKKYSVLEIDLAVQRTLRWESRNSDEAALLTALKNPEKWKHVETEEERILKNEKYLKTLKNLDGRKFGEIYVYVGNRYIEFTGGMKCIQFSIDSKDFIEKVKEYLKRIK